MEEEQGEDSEVLDAMDGWDSEEETGANTQAAGSTDGGADTTNGTAAPDSKAD